MRVRPISPDEVKDKKFEIPGDVIEVVNAMIDKNWTGRSSTIAVTSLVAHLCNKFNISSTEVLQRGYLDFEEEYRAAGWIVESQKPPEDCSTEAHFVFSKPR